MKISVMSRGEIEVAKWGRPTAIISVCDPNTYTGVHSWPEISTTNVVGLLRLAFHDLDERYVASLQDEGSRPDNAHVYGLWMSLTQAGAIVSFVDTMDKLLYAADLVIQCEFGRARSAGIAAAISMYRSGGRTDGGFRERPKYKYNDFIYNLLLCEAGWEKLCEPPTQDNG